MPTTPADVEEITTAEALEILGYRDRSSVTRLVAEGKLKPSRKLPAANGAFLFRRIDIEALAAARRI